MEMAQLGQPVTLEVNFDPGLNGRVGLTVFDVTSGTPVQVGAILNMPNVLDTLYQLNHTPPSAGNWMYRKAVYTNGGFGMLDPDYSRSSESYQVVDFALFAAPQRIPIRALVAKLKAPPRLLVIRKC